MTVYLDPPLWPAHGRHFSHLISDSSLGELHAFARAVGLPERAFEGDHYDVPEERYAALVAAGAVPVPATELARRLRDSGLRFRKRRGERPLARVENGLSTATSAPHVLDVVASGLEQTQAGAAVVLVRAQQWMALVRNASRPGWSPPGGKRERGESVREGAVREVVEETGLVLETGALVAVGYERITVPDGVDPRPFETGVNHLQVFGAVVAPRSDGRSRADGSAPGGPGAVPAPDGLPVLRPDLDDVLEAGWFTRRDAVELAGHEPWWPLVDWWWERG
ncbi:DUF4031 domain-containing protein [Ornithinimicrobium sp. W1679]|uniref:DUF4031 domain-containing protein n=1 Tax=Ornithinimicrobium sp. W1679 TaxID=3418770 RepID=UPI003CF6E40A